MLALVAPLFSLVLLALPGRERLRAAGPANSGHEQLDCVQCHTPADGTVRQQVQANFRHLVGLRSAGADFLHRPVENVDCLACHQNPDDRHPVYRFEEPRFAEVRATLAPQNCVSCHSEHSGRRVTAEPTMCVSCHTDTEIKNDPAVPSHAQLLAEERWSTCLQCHDFHGNHVRTTPNRLVEALVLGDVEKYLAGGPAVYGTEVRYPALTEREIE
jgi:Cytochrome c3